MAKKKHKESTPARVYTDYDKFEADQQPGAVMFTGRASHPGVTTGLIIRCPGCNAKSAMDIDSEAFKFEGPSWTIKSKDPLTLHPSVHHTKEKGGCGWHGWLQDGKWVR